MPVLKIAASCWRRAAEAETQAAQISDRHLKAVYLRIADQWSVLARSYEFADSAERFLLDAKRGRPMTISTAFKKEPYPAGVPASYPPRLYISSATNN
jgi:hypothetical protein